LRSANHDQNPTLLRSIDASIFIEHAQYSKIASSPTRFGELLASGVPSLCSARCGDMQEVIESRNVGVVLRTFTSKTRLGAVQHLLALIRDPHTKERCRKAAEELH